MNVLHFLTMKKFVHSWFFLCIVTTSGCFGQDAVFRKRKFTSTAKNFNVIENSTIYIPCYLNIMENTSTRWFKNDQKIADSNDESFETPWNFHLQANYSLKISNIKRTDSGTYFCEVLYPETDQPLKQIHIVNVLENTSTAWFRNGQKIADSRNDVTYTPVANVHFETNDSLKISEIKRTDSGEYSCEVSYPENSIPKRQSHIVDVLYPPAVFPDPETGFREVELMQGFVLVCQVIGNPSPKIKWYFENNEIFVRNDHLMVYNISRAVKEHNGEYRCVADNSIGNPASASFQVRILYYPAVTAVKDLVHCSIGMKIDLSCKVSANPNAKVEWFLDGNPLSHNARFQTRISENEYILTVNNVRYSDFGNYTCRAYNFLGSNFAKIILSGLPNPPVFKTDPRIRTENSYTLIWEVDSYDPVSEHSLQFRKQEAGHTHGHWIFLTIPAESRFMSPIHTDKYTLAGLEPASVYEAIVTSRNGFGWSRPSKLFRFSTIGIEQDLVPQELDEIKSNRTEEPTIEGTTTDERWQENAMSQTDAAVSPHNYDRNRLIISTIICICLYTFCN